MVDRRDLEPGTQALHGRSVDINKGDKAHRLEGPAGGSRLCVGQSTRDCIGTLGPLPRLRVCGSRCVP